MTGERRPAAGSPGAEALLVTAVVGLNLAFLPLLVLLLPRRVETLSGTGSATVLSTVLVAGAITASLGNVAAGRIGDWWLARYGTRRGMIGWSLPALIASFGAVAAAETTSGLVGAIVFFQISLNLVFSPTVALLADHVPADRRGAVAGAMGTALPLASLATGGFGWAFGTDDNAAFVVLSVIVAAMVAPLPLLWRFGPAGKGITSAERRATHTRALARPLIRLWLARLLVQLTAAFVFSYLFLRLSGLVATTPAWAGLSPTAEAARLTALGGLAAIVGAAAGGRISDRLGSRRVPLAVAAAGLAAALAVMGRTLPPLEFLAAFALFQLSLSAYLAIDSAWIATLIAGNERRGLVLGIMNLTNTLPAILAPAFTLAALDQGQFQSLLATVYTACAACAAAATVLVATIGSRTD